MNESRLLSEPYIGQRLSAQNTHTVPFPGWGGYRVTTRMRCGLSGCGRDPRGYSVEIDGFSIPKFRPSEGLRKVKPAKIAGNSDLCPTRNCQESQRFT